jgi:hypothetical protein
MDLGPEYDVDQRRRALSAFLMAHKELSARKLSVAGGLSNSAVSQFLVGNVRSLTDETYERLAWAATALLKRHVSAAELRGEVAAVSLIAVDFFVGPGAQLFSAGVQERDRLVPAPPGLAMPRVAVVRDEFGLPLFERGDVLYFAESTKDVVATGSRVAMVELSDGRQMVRHIVAGDAGRFSIQALAAGSEPEDVTVVSAARLAWVMYG